MPFITSLKGLVARLTGRRRAEGIEESVENIDDNARTAAVDRQTASDESAEEAQNPAEEGGEG